MVTEMIGAQGVDENDDQIAGSRAAHGFPTASQHAGPGNQGARQVTKESGAALRHAIHDTTAAGSGEERHTGGNLAAR